MFRCGKTNSAALTFRVAKVLRKRVLTEIITILKVPLTTSVAGSITAQGVYLFVVVPYLFVSNIPIPRYMQISDINIS